mgnify:CR=1 FL=1
MPEPMTTVLAFSEVARSRVAASFLPTAGPLPPDQTTVPTLRMQVVEEEAAGPGQAGFRLETETGQTLPLVTIATHVHLRSSEVLDAELSSARAMVERAAGMLARLEDSIVFNGHPPVVWLRGPRIYTVATVGYHAGLLYFARNLPLTWVRRRSLIRGIVDAIEDLERTGHFGPFEVVLGHGLFSWAHRPSPSTSVAV